MHVCGTYVLVGGYMSRGTRLLTVCLLRFVLISRSSVDMATPTLTQIKHLWRCLSMGWVLIAGRGCQKVHTYSIEVLSPVSLSICPHMGVSFWLPQLPWNLLFPVITLSPLIVRRHNFHSYLFAVTKHFGLSNKCPLFFMSLYKGAEFCSIYLNCPKTFSLCR